MNLTTLTNWLTIGASFITIIAGIYQIIVLEKRYSFFRKAKLLIINIGIIILMTASMYSVFHTHDLKNAAIFMSAAWLFIAAEFLTSKQTLDRFDTFAFVIQSISIAALGLLYLLQIIFASTVSA